MKIFDAHFHIIDFNYPIFENQGYLPPEYSVEDYLMWRVAPLYLGHFRDSTRVI